ncbi:flavin monoamine oxidase family protein [Actinomycetospora sp. CA-053990]|uniref:flavin monoamine oxidase family protein n=1 Tax=Actinomycetospora sp. CA-053990 TaxID=3239891 RepID=UPI003D8AEB05
MTDTHHEEVRADVVVVGAGLSGLTAALRLVERGLSVRVLEAGTRVGGRTRDLDVGDDVVTEGGGQWIGAKHERMFALLADLGLATFPTHTAGKTLYLHRGRRRTFGGTIPPMRPWAMLDFVQAQLRLERMAQHVPVATPWTAPRAVEWDGTTLGHWLDTHCHADEAKQMFTFGFSLVFCEDPHRISLLKVLHQIRTSGGIDFMLNTENGAQETRIVGGSQRPSLVVADRLGDDVVLDSPVTEIHQTDDEVLVRSARLDVRAQRAIVAMTPADADRIRFTPDLPTRRAALQRVWHNGTESKIFAVYDRPFWRDQGLNGAAVTDLPVAHYVIDNSPPDASIGILLSFVGTTGPDEILDDSTARRAALLTDLETLFGSDAGRPVRVLEQNWVHEPWISGCVSTRAPGVMTAYTDATTKAVGRVHWAGTEAAPEFEGYLEGAVRSAERAVGEVVAATRPTVALASYRETGIGVPGS